MTAAAFEQLVYELAHRKNPDVKRLAAPDGGADTLKPPTNEAQAVVWQAKHYPSQINWKECEQSLHSSIERWTPSDVIFVFPRDFSQQVEASYQNKLVKPAQTQGVRVRAWTLSDLVRLLNEHGDLKSRFFGATQNVALDALNRAIQAGGTLEDASDLVERAKAIAEFTEAEDPDFTYQTTAGGADTPAPKWDELPYMTMTVGNTKMRLHVAAWAREGTDLQSPTFSFKSDISGQRARRAAVEALAEGQEAIVRNGAQIQMHAPKLFRDELQEPGVTEARLSPGESLPLMMEIHTSQETMAIEVDLRPVPPPPNAAASFAGFVGRVLVEINLELLERPRMRASVNLHGVPSTSPRDSSQAAALLLAFDEQTHISLASDDLFPEKGKIAGPFGERSLSDEKRRQLEQFKQFYEDLVLLEEHTGQEISIPEEFFWQDVAAAEKAAEIVRNEGGSVTVGQMTTEVEDPSEIPSLPERLAEGDAIVQHSLSMTVFGQALHLGTAEHPIPKMKIVEVSPYGDGPQSPARVVLEVDGDPEVSFRLHP